MPGRWSVVAVITGTAAAEAAVSDARQYAGAPDLYMQDQTMDKSVPHQERVYTIHLVARSTNDTFNRLNLFFKGWIAGRCYTGADRYVLAGQFVKDMDATKNKGVG